MYILHFWLLGLVENRKQHYQIFNQIHFIIICLLIFSIKKISNSITNSTIYYNHILTHATNLNVNINPISYSLSIFISPSTNNIARLLQCLKTSHPNDPIGYIFLIYSSHNYEGYIYYFV